MDNAAGCLLGALQVRLAVPDDVVALHGLMGDVSNAMQLQEAFLHAVGAWQAAGAVDEHDARFSAGGLHTVFATAVEQHVCRCRTDPAARALICLALVLTVSECWY